MTIGARIANLRKQKGMTQEQIAQRLNVTRQAVSKWEQDMTSPDSWNMIELARLLDTSVEFLVQGREVVLQESPADSCVSSSIGCCGNDCASCQQKSSLNCPGCRAGSKYHPEVSCTISRCCNSRNLRLCRTCPHFQNCENTRKGPSMPEARISRKKADEDFLNIRSEIADSCRRSISWLFLIALIYTVISNLLGVAFPAIGAIVGLAYALCLFFLKRQSDSFGSAAILMLSFTAVRCITGIFFHRLLTDNSYTAPFLIASFAVVILLPFLRRWECIGYYSLACYFDADLASSMDMLWKWYFIVPAAQLGLSIFLTWIGVDQAGTLLNWISSACAVILDILFLVNLRKLSNYIKNTQ